MDMAQNFGAGGADAVSALIASLETEFGCNAGRALADRFLAAEDTDFHWVARVSERFLGSYQSLDEEDDDLDRVAIVGELGGLWFMAVVLVDGEGRAHGMIARASFGSEAAARNAWAHAR